MVEKKVEKIVVTPLNKRIITVQVEGDMLLMNRKSDDVEAKLKEYFEGGIRNKRISVGKKKDLEEIIEGKMYYTEKGEIGFPAAGFKTGIVNVAPKCGIYKNSIQGSIRVLGNIIPIKYKKKTVHEAWGRTAGRNRTPKLAIRPCFHDWSCELKIEYNADMVEGEQIVNLLNWAVSHQGLGDWRPEKNGDFGVYQVKASK